MNLHLRLYRTLCDILIVKNLLVTPAKYALKHTPCNPVNKHAGVKQGFGFSQRRTRVTGQLVSNSSKWTEFIHLQGSENLEIFLAWISRARTSKKSSPSAQISRFFKSLVDVHPATQNLIPAEGNPRDGLNDSYKQKQPKQVTPRWCHPMLQAREIYRNQETESLR